MDEQFRSDFKAAVYEAQEEGRELAKQHVVDLKTKILRLAQIGFTDTVLTSVNLARKPNAVADGMVQALKVDLGPDFRFSFEIDKIGKMVLRKYLKVHWSEDLKASPGAANELLDQALKAKPKAD